MNPALIISLLLAGLSTGLAEPRAKGVDTVFYHGTISRISGASIVILERDTEQGKDVEISYTLAPKITLESVPSLKDLKPGNQVGFFYLAGKTRNTIVRLVLYPPEEEETPGEALDSK